MVRQLLVHFRPQRRARNAEQQLAVNRSELDLMALLR
jgi:hypothetical protein